MMDVRSINYLSLESNLINDFEEKNIFYFLKNKQGFHINNTSIIKSFSSSDLKKAKEMYNIPRIFKNMDYYSSLALSDEIEKSMEVQQNLCFKLFKREYLEKLSICENLITQVSDMLEKIKIIGDDLKNAYRNCYDFRVNYEKLVKEEKNLIILKDKIAENLEVYDSLDSIFKLLNTSGVELITKSEFPDILKKLDKGLLIMKEHPEYRDSKVYSMKYKECLTKAMTLICIFFVQTMKKMHDEIHKNISYKDSDNIIQHVLLYRKFHVCAFQLKPFIREIELRAKNYNEYHILINDCENSYFGIRYKLINQMVLEKLNELSLNEDIIAFTRLSITFFQSLCIDEFSLFHEFFENENSKFYHFAQKLFKPLSSNLQLRLNKGSDLSLLCDVLSIIKTQLFQDIKNEVSSDIYLDHYNVDFSVIFNEIIQVIQSRIISDVRNVAVLEIQNFVPNKNEFNSLLIEAFETQERNVFNTSVSEWYPTLNKTISLLSKIYPLLDNKLFNNIAYDIIAFCISSFIHASQIQINIFRDKQLFLIKHLLGLREKILEFNIDFFHFEPEININTVNTNSWDIYNKMRLLNFLEFYKSSRTKTLESSVNEKNIFNKFNSVLQTAINSIIEHSLKPFTEPIQEIRNIKCLSKDIIETKINKSLLSIQKEIPIIKRIFLNYIKNTQIIHIIFTEMVKKFSDELNEIKKDISSQFLATWSEIDQLISCLTRLLLSDNTLESSLEGKD